MTIDRRAEGRVALATVLVVDDAPETRRILRRVLEVHGFAVVEATDGEHALEACRHESPDVVVLDIDFGSGPEEGLATLGALKASPRTGRTPVIVMSEQANGREAVSALSLGAADYIRRPFDPEELAARVQTELVNRALQRELEDRAERLDALTGTDPLTALANRRALDAELDELRRARGGPAPVAVFVVDLDHFKRINDESGHLVGDAVLRIAARRIAGAAGETATVVRWGGEEFLAILPGASEADLAPVAEVLRRCVCDARFALGGDRAVAVTASVGAALATLDTFEAAVEAADQAMYEAKAAGRNRVVVAASGISPE